MSAPTSRKMTRARYERERRNLAPYRVAQLLHVDIHRLGNFEHRRPAGAPLTQRVAKLYQIADPMSLFDEVVVSLTEVATATPWNEIGEHNANCATKTLRL